ncbi:GldG family protein [Halorientalis brevis]|uniref:GldG family protein n=1 Tax=Halorientalis brevis TaxID=1126241 RepID=A0ABD6CID1_9EURY|nr:GldG family protein [Halorientalis brevis]
MSKSRLAGVFVAIVTVIVLLGAVAPLLASTSGSQGRTATNASILEPSSHLVDVPDQTGNVTVDAGAESKVVVIDRSHANGFTRAQIQPFVRSLVEAGHEVRFHGSGKQQQFQSKGINRSLRGADALVVIAPQKPFASGEVKGVTDFANRGGRVLMLAEPSRTEVSGGLMSGISVTQVSTELTSIASQFDVAVGTGYLYNMHENANNFQHVYATPPNESQSIEGVERAVFQRATPVAANGSSAEVLLTATNRTRLSTTRANEQYGVAARSGNATVIGDATFLSPSNYATADNEVLIGHAIEFLVTGSKTAKQAPTQTDRGQNVTQRFPQPGSRQTP